ncbi:HAMP domain-containing sensor histidine kinase [Dactylosporangium sp. NPDC005572]|uniref:sensor histidine kinase n=1 Tax=Dactylosporangium sp. NPDC005572 TaxID=3156889 RepID=UPI0033BF3A43
MLLALLMGCVLAALSVPFGRSLAAGRQQDMFVDRLQDTSQFAAIAQQATTSVAQEALRDDLVRYADLYGITAAVVGRGGTTWAISGRLADLDRGDVAERIRQAGAGHQSIAPLTIWPWSDRLIVVAVPVIRGDNVVAVAVTVSATTRLRVSVGRDLLLLVIADLAAMVLLVGVSIRLAAWVLRPVYVLDAAARRISSGDLTARVGGATGPVELRRLSATFNGMAQAVDLAMQRQEAFVADASHQLRNPLAALVLRLEALGTGVDEQRRQQLDLAREEATRLGGILDELLELATVVHVAARPVLVDVGDLVDARIAAWQLLADRRGVQLHGPADAVSASVTALVDPILVSSALDAVLDNAVKFTPSGGRVAVTVTAMAASVDIEVTDSGPGLSEEDLVHVGDRFWRSAASQNIAGSGLGLSIARALLDTNGAILRFAAATPHGLRVTMRLPRPVEGAA